MIARASNDAKKGKKGIFSHAWFVTDWLLFTGVQFWAKRGKFEGPFVSQRGNVQPKQIRKCGALLSKWECSFAYVFLVVWLVDIFLSLPAHPRGTIRLTITRVLYLVYTRTYILPIKTSRLMRDFEAGVSLLNTPGSDSLLVYDYDKCSSYYP